MQSRRWDAYIAHSSEDKDEIVSPLAEALEKREIKVWYDKSIIEYGNNILQNMDDGLVNSNSGILILSHAFFQGSYALEELYALLDDQINNGKKIFLVLHNITKEELRKYSPILATRRFLRSSEGIDNIAEKLSVWVKSKDPNASESETLFYSQPNEDEYVFFSKWDLSDEAEKFSLPEGIDMDLNGYFYVADEAGYVRKLDLIGSLLKKWGGKGSGNGKFTTAYALAIDPIGNVLVSDSGATDNSGNIQKFDSEGNFLKKLPTPGDKNIEFKNPYGIAIDPFGNIFVSEEKNHRIQKFDSNGILLIKWGKEGKLNGEFQDPIGIATDFAGNVYVADYLNNRIQVFDNDGKFIQKWGSFGKRDGEFDHPHGITVDSNGLVYVSDSSNNRIQKFTKNGIFITSWGSEGDGDGEFRTPRDLLVDKEGTVYVSDGSNNRIQIFVQNNKEKRIKLKDAERILKEQSDDKQIAFYLEKILSLNNNSAEVSWKGLYELARHRIIAKNNDIWKAINREILQLRPGSFATESLDLLKLVSYNANKMLGYKNEITTKANYLYKQKLKEILESIDGTWQHQKMFSKQVLDQITDEIERYEIFWKAWKKCAEGIIDDTEFTKFTSFFINDLVNSRPEFKTSIQAEIFTLMESSKSHLSQRAKDLHMLLFKS